MALIMMSVLQLHNVPCMIGTENSADAMYSHVVHVLYNTYINVVLYNLELLTVHCD